MMAIIFYILLAVGIFGVLRGILRFFILGRDAKRAGAAYDLIYQETVSMVANYLVLIVGALICFWLVQTYGS
jgi:hypothetical protein